MDDEVLLNTATEAYVRDLGLDDDSMLQGKIEIKDVAAGSYLIKEDSIKVRFQFYLSFKHFIIFTSCIFRT